MAHVIYTYPVNSSGTLTVNNGSNAPSLEIFNEGTHTTTAESSATATVEVADTGRFNAGDTIRIGTNAAVSILSITDADTMVIDTNQTWSNNDAVVLTVIGVGSVDNVALLYDDPLMSGGSSNSITQASEAFTADSNNQWEFYIEDGTYSIRVADASSNTLFLATHVDFGDDAIRLGGGQTSDSDGLLEAFRQLGSDGGNIDLAGATFTLGEQGVCTASNVVLRGKGSKQTTIKMDGSSTFHMLKFTGDNITIEGITFDGNGATNTNTNALLQLVDNNNITIRDCVFRNCNNHALWLDYSASGGENVTVDNCEFTDFDVDGSGSNAITTEKDWKFIRVSNCYFHDAPTASGECIRVGGTGATAGPSSDVVITNCNFDTIGPLDGSTTARGVSFGSPTGSRADGLTVSNCIFRKIEGDCISLTNADHIAIGNNVLIDFEEAGIFMNGCRWASVTGNTLKIDSAVTPDSSSGISFGWTADATTDVASRYITVVGNTLFNMDPANASGQGAISCSCSGDTDSKTGGDFVIANNVMYHETTSMAQYGIWLRAHPAGAGTPVIQDVTVMGNYIENAQEEGIRCIGVTRPHIFNNVIVGSGTDPIELTAGTASTGVKLGNNDFGSGTTGDCSGQDALVSGTVTISTKAAHTGMKVSLNASTIGGTQGILSLGTVTNGTSFVINSSNGADTSTIDWMIIE